MQETTGHKLEKIVRNLSNLPSLPFIAQKLSSTTEDSRAAVKDIVDIISVDQSLTAKLLKLVNSSFYGFSSKVSTVTRAVVILGMQNIKTLALGVSVFKTASTLSTSNAVFDVQKFWEHSLGVAAGAKLLARFTGSKQVEEAFLGGLLHDIGKIIFNEYMPNEFSQALEMSLKQSIPLNDAENKIIKADHEIAGDYLAERWKLPLPLRRCVSQHHRPPFNEQYLPPEIIKLVAIVSLANTLCKMRNIGFSGNSIITPRDEMVMNWLHVQENEMERFFLEIDAELLKAKEFLGILEAKETEDPALSGVLHEKKKTITIICKDTQKTILTSLFIKNSGFDCQKFLWQELDYGSEIFKESELILTEGLSAAELLSLQNQLNKLPRKIQVFELPHPYNPEKILNLLKKINS